MQSSISICQIALSAADLLRTHAWYERAIGLLPAGQKRHLEGPLFARVPGLPEAAFDVFCLVDQQPFFQLEIFEFTRPRTKPMPAEWRLCDIGYSMMGIHIADFDAGLDRIVCAGGRLITAPYGDRGQRRVCLRDPDGILIELFEQDFRAASAAKRAWPSLAAIQSITVSVPSIERARRFWVDTLGCRDCTDDDVRLHGEEHEVLWGLPGAKRSTLLLQSGHFFIELVQYDAPLGAPRPAGYLISDHGILNVALGTQTRAELDEVYGRAIASGYRPNRAPWTLKDVATVVYLNDDQGFSVELLHVEPTALARMGFVPNPEPVDDDTPT